MRSMGTLRWRSGPHCRGPPRGLPRAAAGGLLYRVWPSSLQKQRELWQKQREFSRPASFVQSKLGFWGVVQWSMVPDTFVQSKWVLWRFMRSSVRCMRTTTSRSRVETVGDSAGRCPRNRAHRAARSLRTRTSSAVVRRRMIEPATDPLPSTQAG